MTTIIAIYVIGLILACVPHIDAILGGKPSMKVRWLWTFLTVFWPVGIAYFVCKYLFWE